MSSSRKSTRRPSRCRTARTRRSGPGRGPVKKRLDPRREIGVREDSPEGSQSQPESVQLSASRFEKTEGAVSCKQSSDQIRTPRRDYAVTSRRWSDRPSSSVTIGAPLQTLTRRLTEASALRSELHPVGPARYDEAVSVRLTTPRRIRARIGGGTRDVMSYFSTRPESDVLVDHVRERGRPQRFSQ